MGWVTWAQFPAGLSIQSFVCAVLLISGLFLGRKPARGRHRRWYQRAERLGPAGVERLPPSTALHQLLPEPLPGLRKIRKYLSPALGFNFLSVSLKVPLTRCPSGSGVLQGEFLCTEH